jgi:hypothetical protein
MLINLIFCSCAALAKDGKYQVRVQTRNPEHRAAQELAKLPNVSFHVGHIESEELLREAMQGMDGVFFLANGFAIGEKAEIFWSMRAFEIARELGIKFFQFSSIDYYLKKGGYDPKFRCVHADTKGRIAGIADSLFCSIQLATTLNLMFDLPEWIQHQPVRPMKWAILTSSMSYLLPLSPSSVHMTNIVCLEQLPIWR